MLPKSAEDGQPRVRRVWQLGGGRVRVDAEMADCELDRAERGVGGEEGEDVGGGEDGVLEVEGREVFPAGVGDGGGCRGDERTEEDVGGVFLDFEGEGCEGGGGLDEAAEEEDPSGGGGLGGLAEGADAEVEVEEGGHCGEGFGDEGGGEEHAFFGDAFDGEVLEGGDGGGLGAVVDCEEDGAEGDGAPGAADAGCGVEIVGDVGEAARGGGFEADGFEVGEVGEVVDVELVEVVGELEVALVEPVGDFEHGGVFAGADDGGVVGAERVGHETEIFVMDYSCGG